jgi:hypothetical protein
VFGDKSEKIEITLGVADHAREIVDLKQTQISMIILDAFLLELGALFRRKVVRFALRLRAGRPFLIIFQERLAIVRALTIGTACYFHLQHAKVDPELQLLAAIEADDLAHLDVAVLMRPIFQDGI